MHQVAPSTSRKELARDKIEETFFLREPDGKKEQKKKREIAEEGKERERKRAEEREGKRESHASEHRRQRICMCIGMYSSYTHA